MRKGIISFLQFSLLFVLLCVIIFIFTWVVLFYKEKRNYEKRGAQLIDKIETYRKVEKRLPKNGQQLGIDEMDEKYEGPYYEKTDSLNYRVIFYIGFDETFSYDSRTKAWKSGP